MRPRPPLHKVVAAAIIERDGRILLHRRPPGSWGEGLWEFPGGKVEVGEDPRSALARECEEELGVLVDVGHVFEILAWDYSDTGPVLLLFFHATLADGEPSALLGGEIAWAQRGQLLDYKWLPADYPIVERLAAE